VSPSFDELTPEALAAYRATAQRRRRQAAADLAARKQLVSWPYYPTTNPM
jgi:hypothetical protein